jgi:capsular exopolysaccharide synthesis family protein
MHGDTDTPMKTLMVTSCRENEGKSTVAANIAYSLYESGKNVLIIDLDLVNPSIYKIFSVTESLTTLKNFLMGEKVENLIRTLEDDGLSAIINTERISDTLDLLSSKRLEQLLKSVRDSFDYIIIDSPPISNVADSEILADLMDATLLVIKQNYVKEENIIDVISQLKASKSELIGCVLNDAVVYSEIGGYDYYNKYRYGYYSYYSDDYYKRDV